MIFINFKSNFTEFLALFPPPTVSLMDIVEITSQSPTTTSAQCHSDHHLPHTWWLGEGWTGRGMGVIHPLPKIGIFLKKYIIYCLLNILHRFRHDEEEDVPPRCLCYVPHSRNTRQWSLSPYAHVTDGFYSAPVPPTLSTVRSRPGPFLQTVDLNLKVWSTFPGPGPGPPQTGSRRPSPGLVQVRTWFPTEIWHILYKLNTIYKKYIKKEKERGKTGQNDPSSWHWNKGKPGLSPPSGVEMAMTKSSVWSSLVFWPPRP